MTDPPPAVSVRDAVVTYGDLVALSIDTLDLPAGALTGVIGPNGSGKSTLLNLISGLSRPRTGTVTVLGGDPVAVRRRVAHVLQSTATNEQVPLTVREVVWMGRYAVRGAFRRFTAADHQIVDDALARLDITDLGGRQIHELSGGQRQRAFVAQGLAQQADVLLLDEPITGLDLVSQEVIESIVATETTAGRSVVLTTHDVDTASRADHVVLLSTEVVASGSPEHTLTADNLNQAYGGKAHLLPDGTVVLGESHHHTTHVGTDPDRHA